MFTCAQLSHPPCPSAPRREPSQAPTPLFTKGTPTACAHFTGGARHPPRFHREGRLELTKASRSRDRDCGNSRRLPPGETRADRAGRYVRVGRRHPSLRAGLVHVSTCSLEWHPRPSGILLYARPLQPPHPHPSPPPQAAQAPAYPQDPPAFRARPLAYVSYSQKSHARLAADRSCRRDAGDDLHVLARHQLDLSGS